MKHIDNMMDGTGHGRKTRNSLTPIFSLSDFQVFPDRSKFESLPIIIATMRMVVIVVIVVARCSIAAGLTATKAEVVKAQQMMAAARMDGIFIFILSTIYYLCGARPNRGYLLG
jgi:hypothetical protein